MAEERTDLNKFDDIEARTDKSGLSMRDDNDDDINGETAIMREQIEETRSEMGGTIDEIQERLSFSNISEQVSEHLQNAVETGKEAIFDATIGKAASFMKNTADNMSNSKVIRTVKDNPIPFVLIGAGVGLLAYKVYSKPSNKQSWRYQAASPQDQAIDRSTGELGSRQFDAITEKASQSAHNAMEKVSATLQQGYARAGDMMNQAYGKADEYKDAAIDQYQTYLNDNPLALGAAALGLGAAIGLAIPSSRYEGELMGETRNELFDKAQNVASGLLDKTKRAIADADLPIMTHKGSAAEH